jgi:hypothetical protein
MFMKLLFIAVSASLVISTAHADSVPTPINSQARLPNEDWHLSRERFHQALESSQASIRSAAPTDNTAEAAAVPLANLDLSSVVQILGSASVLSLFEKARDMRFLSDPTVTSFLRRSSWLYPDDGCFARASFFNQHASQWLGLRPNKIFVFGNLHVVTANSPTGSVDWWYHVAPLVTDGSQVLVLDPALNPRQPTPLLDWLKMMTADTSTLTMSVCNGFAYGPDSSCANATATDESSATPDQTSYLQPERDRLTQLNRSPDKELGDSPPW